MMIPATASAIVLAIFYSWSPLTVWATLVLAALLWWGSHDLSTDERRWFLSLSILALTLRYAALAALPVVGLGGTHPYQTFFGDDLYNVQRSLWLHHLAVGIPIAPWDFFEAFQPISGRSGYQYVLAFAHVIAGPSPYGVLLLNVVMHAATVVILYRLVRRSYGSAQALVAAAILWYFPTLFAWSVSALKEPPQLFLSAVALAASVAMVRGSSWQLRAGAALVVALALVAILPLRVGALAILATGLAIGFVLRLVTLRTATVVTALAASFIVLAVLLPHGRLLRLIEPELRAAVKRHVGSVESGGEFYRLLDKRYYVTDVHMPDTPILRAKTLPLDTAERVRFLVLAPIAFLLEPRLWSLPSAKWIALVPVQTLWYTALLAALPGVIVAMRRDALLTCLVGGLIISGVALISPTSGNLGTLVRHRDIVSPFVFVFSAVGIVASTAAIARRSRAATRSQDFDDLVVW